MQIMSNESIRKEYRILRRDGATEKRAIELIANRYMMTPETARSICLPAQKEAA